MNSIIIIFFTAVFTLIPFSYYNRKEMKSGWLEVLAFGILGLAITFLIMKVNDASGGYLEMFITGGICSIFNYFAVRGDINNKLVTKSLIVLLLFFLSSLSQLLIIPILGYDIDNLTANQNLILTTFSDGLLLIILAIMYFKTLKEDFKNLKGKINENLDVGVKYWLLGLLVMMISNVIIGLCTKAQAVNEEGVQELIHASRFLSVFTIGIIAPILEELTFRKAFRDVFKNDLAFILMSGFVFGALHVVLSFTSLWDLLYIIPYSSLGIAFAATYAKTKNIYVSTFMHMFHNTALTILSLIGLGAILW